MKKVILLADSDPVIFSLLQRIEEMNEHREQQINFLKKQAKDLDDKTAKEVKPIWEDIQKLLQEKGLLKDYNESKQHIGFSIAQNTIMVSDNCEHEISLKNLLSGLIPLD